MASQALEPMSRRDRERERHRREILEAAERIFGRNGYRATTVEAIAKEAEFAVGTLYKFFKGKEDIYSHVIEALFQRFMRECEESVLSIDDPEEAIAALIALRLMHSDEHRQFLRISSRPIRAAGWTRLGSFPLRSSGCTTGTSRRSACSSTGHCTAHI